jgi:hypothetical protein
MEFILYGLKPNETRDYMEDLLCVKNSLHDIDIIKDYAKSKGFHSFRIATFAGEKPDFLKSINPL